MQNSTPVKQTLENSKTYLGDGVYARIENGTLVLTSENGVVVQNEIFLESFVLFAVINYSLQQGIIKNV